MHGILGLCKDSWWQLPDRSWSAWPASARVPADSELGYHLDYGDYQGRRWKHPEDTAKLIEVATP